MARNRRFAKENNTKKVKPANKSTVTSKKQTEALVAKTISDAVSKYIPAQRQKNFYQDSRDYVTRPSNYPSEDVTLKAVLRKLRAMELSAYYHALLFPYNFVQTRMPVALPNGIPVPTTTTYHLQKLTWADSTKTSVNFMARFPSKLARTQEPARGRVPTIFQCTATDTTPPSNWTSTFIMSSLNDVRKARLVGMEFRVTYTGPLLEQSGTIESGMMFTNNIGQLQTTLGTAANTNFICPNLEYIGQMSWYELQTINQGTTTRCVYIPVDYNDRNFYTSHENTSLLDVINDLYHDMTWFVRCTGFGATAKFLLEVAYIWENQIDPVQDVFPKFVSHAALDSMKHDAIIEKGIEVRNNSGFLDKLSSSLGNLASKGLSYLGDHAETLLQGGMKALASILI